jgi:hypothetical protein
MVIPKVRVKTKLSSFSPADVRRVSDALIKAITAVTESCVCAVAAKNPSEERWYGMRDTQSNANMAASRKPTQARAESLLL